jgi:hypothetical protein
MQQRVASEIVTAAGFESQCVGATLDDTVEKVVTYAHNGVLQDRMIETMKQYREEKVGFYDVMRCPRFLAYAVERVYDQKAAVASGDRERLKILQYRSKLAPWMPWDQMLMFQGSLKSSC